MVAEAKKDQKSNTSKQYYADGVPTLFHHVLSNLEFKAKTNKAYTDNEKFALKSIKLKGVLTKGTYTQGSKNENAAEGVWSAQATADEMPIVSNTTAVSFTNDGNVNDVDATTHTIDYSIVLPQKFADETSKIEIVYEITTNYTAAHFPFTTNLKKKENTHTT